MSINRVTMFFLDTLIFHNLSSENKLPSPIPNNHNLEGLNKKTRNKNKKAREKTLWNIITIHSVLYLVP